MDIGKSPSRRSRRARGLVVLVDQGVSAASNLFPMLVLAHVADAATYGRLAVLYAGAVLLLTATRSTYGEAVLAGFWKTAPDYWRAVRGLGLPVLSLAVLCSGVFVTLGGSASVAVVSVPLLVAMVFQDQLRQYLIKAGRATEALVGDLIWLAFGTSLALLLARIGSEPAAIFLAWEVSVVPALMYLYMRCRADLRPARATVPEEQRSLLGLLAINGAVSVAVYLISPITLLTAGADAAGHLRMAQLAVAPTTLLALSAAPLFLPSWSADRLAASTRRAVGLFFSCAVLGTSVSAAFAVAYAERIFPLANATELRVAVVLSAVLSLVGMLAILGSLRLKAVGLLTVYGRMRALFGLATVLGTILGGATLGLSGVLAANIAVAAMHVIATWGVLRTATPGNPSVTREVVLDSSALLDG